MVAKVKDFFRLEGYYALKRLSNKYYVIYRTAGGAGFFSNYMWVLGHITFARRFGYIPVVDMKNYPTLYSEDISVDGEDNAWNYYFKDPGDINLEQVYQSKRYVMGCDKYLTKYAEKYAKATYRYPTEKMINYYGDIIGDYIKLRSDLEQEFRDKWSEKVKPADHVLGIHIRGTDMKNNLGHPMPASVQKYLEYTHELLGKYPEINKIFLATDENNVKEAFEKEFAGMKQTLFMNDVFRVWDKGEAKKIGVHETKVENPRPYHKYLMGKEVLQDAWFLNKSEYLICGHSNITNVVLIWNQNQYKQVVCVE